MNPIYDGNDKIISGHTIPVQVSRIIPEENFEPVKLRREADVLVAQLTAKVVGFDQEKINVFRSWPADWWQAFKERWFPGWLKKRFPVRMETFSLNRKVYGAVCPHMVATPGHAHLQWSLFQGKPHYGDIEVLINEQIGEVREMLFDVLPKCDRSCILLDRIQSSFYQVANEAYHTGEEGT